MKPHVQYIQLIDPKNIPKELVESVFGNLADQFHQGWCYEIVQEWMYIW